MTGTRHGRPSGRHRLYLVCPRCGLSINPRASRLAIEHCPRCLGRSRTAVPMVSSPLAASELYDERLMPREPSRSDEVTEPGAGAPAQAIYALQLAGRLDG